MIKRIVFNVRDYDGHAGAVVAQLGHLLSCSKATLERLIEIPAPPPLIPAKY